VIYNNYMFRPCNLAIIRLFTESSSRLHNKNLGDEISPYIILSMLLYGIILTMELYVSYELHTDKWFAIVSTYNYFSRHVISSYYICTIYRLK